MVLRISNISTMARGVKPGCSGEPWIVKVFPEPVYPYAKMQTLYPSIAD